MGKAFKTIHLLLFVGLFGVWSAPSAEAHRRHTSRAPSLVSLLGLNNAAASESEVQEAGAQEVEAQEEVEPAAAEPAVEEESVPQKKQEAKPKRGLWDLLFGRGQAAPDGPAGGVDMDERMLDAARVAEKSARSRSINRCWRYVKRALQEAELVDCYPRTALAKQAGGELAGRYGFKQLEVTDPHDAPVGAVLVYGGRGAGHVEIRTEHGFVSDHASLKPSPRPLIGVFVKPAEG